LDLEIAMIAIDSEDFKTLELLRNWVTHFASDDDKKELMKVRDFEGQDLALIIFLNIMVEIN